MGLPAAFAQTVALRGPAVAAAGVPKGQEDQLAALGLVLNAVVLWNTRYLDAAVAQLRAEGHDTKDEDVAPLYPLKGRHINFLGRYLFNIKASGPGRDLRPLCDPDAPELNEDDKALD